MATRRTEVSDAAASPRRSPILCVYAALLLAATILFPWWRMDCRAPQYGARVLSIEVTPVSVSGDTREIDILGHYVGMRSVLSFAPLERVLAPFGLGLAALLALAIPFLRSRRARWVAAAIVVAVPIGFAADLRAWQYYATTHLDPNVSLNMIQNRVQSRLVGSYQIAQFSVRATFQEGFWFAVIAAFNVLGFVLSGGGARLGWLRRAGAVARAALPVLAVLLASAAASRAATLRVGAGAEHATLQSALSAARPGDVIRVLPGVYRERLRVDRPVALRAEPGAILDGGGVGTVLTVAAGPTEVRGLSIRGSGDSLVDEDAGVRIVDAEGCTVADNRVEDALFGILVVSSGGARVTGNRIVGKDLPRPRRGDGIRLYNSSGCTVSGNTVERSRDLAIWQSHRVEARHNTVRASRYGLHYMYCDDNLFEDNVFEDNQVGGAIMYSRRLTLRRNRFTGSRGIGAVGLLIKTGDDVLAEHNRILDNTRGIFLEDAPQAARATCVVRDNVVGGNDVAISLQPSVNRAVFTGNAFVANRVQVEVLGGADRPRNVWSRNGRGNYWSDYVGFDADGDGVGDTPYRVEHFFEDLTNRWPEVGLLRMGPAVEAIDMASRAFPIGAPRLILQDDAPLVHPPAGAGERARARPELAFAGAALVAAVPWLLRRASAPYLGRRP